MSILSAIYVITALLLAVYGFNAWVLTILYLKHRRTIPLKAKEIKIEDRSPVTVQLPIFNEALVVERLIDVVVRLDYQNFTMFYIDMDTHVILRYMPGILLYR